MAGFASGFFGTVANNISDKRDFIRNRVEEDRMYLREQGLKRQAAVTEQRGAYERVARSLIRAGADERTVLGTLEMDPEGLMEVYDKTRNEDIGPAALNQMMSISSEYQGSASMSEILDKILPTAVALPNDADPLTARKKTLAAWLGLDTETELNEQIYAADVLPGMTGDQIIASMNIPVSARGTNTEGVTYDFTRVTPLSATEANQLIATANTDYGADWQANRISELERELTEGGDPAAIQAEKEFLKSLPNSGPGRLQAILGSPYGYEVGPTTANLAAEYGDRLFGVKQGFNATFLPSILGTPEETIRRAEGEVDNPEETQTPPPATVVEPPVEPPVEVNPEADVVLINEEEANAMIAKHFDETGDTSAVVQLPDGTLKVVNRIVDDTRGEVLVGGKPVDQFLASQRPGAQDSVDGSVKPVARPSVNDAARPVADDESAFAIIDRINGGTEDPTDLKGRISQAMMTEDQGQRRAQLQSIIVDLQQNWTQSRDTDALLIQLARALES